MKQLYSILKKQSPGRLIALGFTLTILLGAVLLLFPVSINPGEEVSFLDALFTSTSAVCVTGLIAIDTAEHFTVFGRAVIALLIQGGGLGVTAAGAGIMLAAGRRVGLKERWLVCESLNIDSGKGVLRLLKTILLMTVCFELSGAVFSFFVFVQDFPPLKALEISVFHSIAAFNNAGFDILGGLRSLTPYRTDLMLNLLTCVLIFWGGIGFLVIIDIWKSKSFRKLCLHSKSVLITSGALILAGALLLKATENITWLGAFFQSVSARTAGFSSYSIGAFSDTGLFILILLMFIGASPGSTGGGIKTSTFFTLLQSIRGIMQKKRAAAFHRSIPQKAIEKAHDILLLALLVVCTGTLLLCVLEPEYSFLRLLFEVVSAFGTVGLSTGITPGLGSASKLIIIFLMFVGRLGVLSLTSLWINHRPDHVHYVEESITIG